MREEIIQEHAGGMWPWLLQRVTAVILLLGLAVHLFALHIVNLGSLSYDNVAATTRLGGLHRGRLRICSAAGLFHALNGLRMVLLDYGFTGGRETRPHDCRVDGRTGCLWLRYVGALAVADIVGEEYRA